MAFHTSFTGIVNSLSLSNPIGLGVNIILSTIIGGIIFLIVSELLAKGFRENIRVYRAFGIVLAINIINMFGIINLVPQLTTIPSFILQAAIWIGLVKLGFSRMSLKHSIVVGIVGFIISILIIPNLVSLATNYLPL